MKNVVIWLVLLSVGLPVLSIAGVPESIKLPAPQTSGGMPLSEALALRRTTRNFAPDALPPQLLSSLLWSAFGVNRPGEGKRTAPSARNWQEIDIYVALPDGLFLYNAAENILEGVLAADVRAAAGSQAFTDTAPVVLIYVADYSRMRGADAQGRMFYSATDTGFISQNVYLFSAANQLATVVLGMVDKEALKEIMDLRDEQHVVLSQPVGFPQGAVPPAAATSLKDGVYRASAKGYIDEIVMEITVQDGIITAAEVVEHRENRPKTAIEAVPNALVGKSSIEEVDTITGATVTSRAILRAAEKALNQARE